MQTGLLLSAFGSFVPARATAGSAAAGIWVVDDTLPDAAAIGAEARANAAAVFSFAADPGQIWMNKLAPRLELAPVAIGAYTSASALFCLHYLARDYGLRLTAVGDGLTAPESVASDDDSPIDLRAARFSNRNTAYTWLMSPRSA